nr:cytochrome P450 3045C1 [Brachionus rubens]
MSKEALKLSYNQIIEYINYVKILNLIDRWTWVKLSGTSLLGFTAIYLGKIWYSYRFFKNLGIKTPEYKFFYGNHLELTRDKKYSEVLRDWTNKYGKTYGYYQGHLPILVTSDLDVIQDVFVKQSSNFSARKRVFGSRDDDSPDHMLFTASRSRWKIIRSIVNPTFSSAKLRELGSSLIKCTDRLNQVLDLEKEIDISEYFKRFTMDSIWTCAFGVDTDIQYDPGNEYNRRSEAIFWFLGAPNLLNFVTNYLHEFQDLFLSTLELNQWLMFGTIDMGKYNPLIWFMDQLYKLVVMRKEGMVKKKDYLQLLIDAESDLTQDKINVDYINTKLDKKLSLNGIKLNLTSFMLAGYETTSTVLTYASYVLIKYPEEQTKLYEAIRSIFETEDGINTDSVQEVKYLDYFIKELLRFYPVANPTVDRRCTKSTRVKNIDIPEGLVISVDCMSLHFDENLWGPVDPGVFYPLRHEVKRNPLGFMAFGNGPRHCLGMKFALAELKIALCKLLLNFEFLPPNDFTGELEMIEIVVRRPKNGVKVILRKRV